MTISHVIIVLFAILVGFGVFTDRILAQVPYGIESSGADGSVVLLAIMIISGTIGVVVVIIKSRKASPHTRKKSDLEKRSPRQPGETDTTSSEKRRKDP